MLLFAKLRVVSSESSRRHPTLNSPKRKAEGLFIRLLFGPTNRAPIEVHRPPLLCKSDFRKLAAAPRLEWRWLPAAKYDGVTEGLGKTVGILVAAKVYPLYPAVLSALLGLVIVDSHLFQIVSGYSR